jgi:hypothetical protein
MKEKYRTILTLVLGRLLQILHLISITELRGLSSYKSYDLILSDVSGIHGGGHPEDWYHRPIVYYPLEKTK